MKQLEVKIMGQGYLLGCPEGGEARLHEAVQRVDAAMCKIQGTGKIKARDRIAVLAALNLAFDVSDRAAPVFPSALAPLAAPAAAAHARTSADDGASDPRLSHLMGRLDSALGDDGRLI